jgi:hypothetical protein
MDNPFIIVLLILAMLGVGCLVVWSLVTRHDDDGYHWTDTDF